VRSETSTKMFLLTVDVEGMPMKDSSWDYSTVLEGVPLLLDIFDEFGIRSTFFVSSDVAANVTDTMNEVIRSGHEVGCHGYNHQPLNLNDQKQQFADLLEATKTIQDHLNTNLVGFRAPFCRIGESTLPILTKLGYKYDSSVVPSPKLYSRHYFPNAPHEPYTPSNSNIERKGDSAITEIPISTLPIFGLPLGLSYCMLFGLKFYKSLLLHFNREIMTLYVHNYDFYSIPREAKVSTLFKLPYLRGKEQKIRLFRELLEFLKEKFSLTFLPAKEALTQVPCNALGVSSQEIRNVKDSLRI